MRKVLIIIDGVADKGNNTSLALAKTPNLDFLAKNGKTGLLYPIKDIAPESGEAQFVLLGYNLKDFPGRGTLEALGINYKLKKNEIAIRGNFARIKNNKVVHSREKIPSKNIIKKLNNIHKDIKIIPTINYRAVIIVKNASPNISNTRPGYVRIKNYSKAISEPQIEKKLKGDKKTVAKLNFFLKEIKRILKNRTILLRGAGKKPTKKFKKLKDWELIADMPVELGLARLFGMKILSRKDEIKQVISSKKNIYVQIKAPDMYGHKGNRKGKISAIERVDKKLKPLTKLKNTLICVTADHATPYQLKRHSKDPVPILIYGRGKDKVKKFSEKACQKGSLGKLEGKKLMKLLI